MNDFKILEKMKEETFNEKVKELDELFGNIIFIEKYIEMAFELYLTPYGCKHLELLSNKVTNNINIIKEKILKNSNNNSFEEYSNFITLLECHRSQLNTLKVEIPKVL